MIDLRYFFNMVIDDRIKYTKENGNKLDSNDLL